MAVKSSSLIIWLFLLLINILQFFPSSLAARNLANTPQPNGSNGYTENNDQSKSGVDGSPVRHAGSASDESAPPNGRGVQRPPASTHSNGGQTVTTYSNGGRQTVTTSSNGGRQTVTTYNNEVDESESESNSVTHNVSGGGGGQVYSTPNAMYEPPSDQEDPRIYYPPPPPFPYYP